MPIFTLTLQRTYYDKGFFNVTVDYDHYVRPDEGPVGLELGPQGQLIEGRLDRHANQNGTPRISGGSALRDWFQTNFQVMELVDVDLSSLDRIRLRRHVDSQ